MKCGKKTQAPKVGKLQLPQMVENGHDLKKKVKIRKNNILKLA